MIKTFTFTILLTFAVYIALSQPFPASTKTIDSLTRIIATQPNDTNRVMNLYLLSRMLTLNNTAQALKYSNEGYLLAQKLDFESGELTNLQAIVFIYAITGEWVKG